MRPPRPLVLMLLAIPACALYCGGCATRHQVVFTDGPVITRVDDTRDIPEPEELDFLRLSHLIDNLVLRQARLGLDPNPPWPARDVNRLGRVVDSSWYTNRIVALDAEAVGRGPGGGDPGPEAYRPWTITGLKTGGMNPGFNFRDSRGAGYICKFDKPGEPIVATAAGAIASRLFWALGYNVPDDRVVEFERGDLRIEDGATVRNEMGHKRALRPDDIDALLESVPGRTPGGGYRALASRFLDGRPVGGYAYSGTREDDPNDTIPHEKRRSLRGLRVFGAWLGHVDQKIDNSLDVYVKEGDRRFLRHYLVDFDACLGGFWSARHEQRIGFHYEFDLHEFFTGLPALGLMVRPYERIGPPEHPQIGVFESRLFDPAAWRPNYVNNYFDACGRADAFWAGTVLAGITDRIIDAAVEAGRYPDPAAAGIAARVLRDRRDKTLRWALTRAAPAIGLDRIVPTGTGLRIRAGDALAAAGLASGLRFGVEVLDRDGVSLGTALRESPTPEVEIPALMEAGLDYMIVRWSAVDADGRRLPDSEGHYLRDAGGWRLIGVLRDGE